jgi:type III secretion system low calcium response chaperone LcrH/SycD
MEEKSIIDTKHEEATATLHGFFHELANFEVGEEGSQQNALVSPENRMKALENKMKERFQLFEEKLGKAVEALKQSPQFDQFFPSKEKFEEVLSNAPPEGFSPDKPLSRILGFSENGLFEIYGIGFESFNKKNYEEASNIFLLLTILYPTFSLFWIALARASELLERFEEASIAYSMALELDPDDPLPAIDAVRCLLKMNKKEKAANLLDSVIEKSEQNEEAKKALSQLQALKKTLA